MAVLPILQVGDDVLRQKSQSVPKITKKILKLIRDMIETMYDAEGVGLAAPQVGQLLRIIVVDLGEDPLVLVNPEIVQAEGEEIDVEACLSVPDTKGYVKRSYRVVVEGLSDRGKPIRLEAEGYLARVFQHEIDHLEGTLFIDKMEAGIEETPKGE